MPTMFGRELELGVVSDLLDAALAGRGRAVLIAGEAGIGKTRLVDEITSRAEESGAAVVRGEAFAGEQAPFGLWRRARPPQLASGGRPQEGLDADDARWAAVDEVRSALTGLGPGVVVLEDLQWADDSSIWSLERLFVLVRELPVMMLATARTTGGLPERLIPLSRSAQILTLEGLDMLAVGRLAAEVAPGQRNQGADIWAATGGNPLLVCELAAASADGLAPRGAMAVLQGALASLTEEGLRVVRGLALVGAHGVPPVVLAQALGVEVATIASAVDDAIRNGVLRRRDGGLRFRHDLLAQAALFPISDADRRRLHAALADAWSRQLRSLDQRSAVARHRLAALPVGDADAGLEAALDAMAVARAAGRADVVIEVGHTAQRALVDLGASGSKLAVQVLLELGDALHEAGDVLGAANACARAADMGSEDLAATVVARSEVGASRNSNPFVPDTARMARLLAVETRIPSGDSALRAAILARLAVLGVALPGGFVEAHRQGDEAIAMARRLGDPRLLVDVLVDRYLAPVGPDDLAARARAAEEIISIGTRLRRPGIVLLGLDWQTNDRLDVGDRKAADAALVQMDLLASVMPSPGWRYTAAFRRVGLLTVAGQRSAALAALELAAALAPTAANVLEATGLELAARVAIARLWGIPDARFPELHERFVAIASPIPAPFVHIQLAWMAAHAGDEAPARAVIDRFGPNLGSLLGSVAGLVAAHLVAEMAADLGDANHVDEMRRTLEPYADRLGVGNGVAVPTPVAATLGRLAQLAGDLDGAAHAYRRAFTLVERAASPSLAALCRRLAGAELGLAGAELGRPGQPLEGAAPRGPGGATLVRDGPVWRINSSLGGAVVTHMLGLEQLARLVALPHTPIDSVDLVGGVATGPRARDLGGILDGRAKREYRQRVVDLQADIDEAEQANDWRRADVARAELDALLRELSRAVGLGGRDRPTGATTERARVSVTRSLRRAIAAITETAPALGAHLERSVRTGRDCRYDPEPAAELRWDVRVG